MRREGVLPLPGPKTDVLPREIERQERLAREHKPRMIVAGASEEAIRARWVPDVERYREKRVQYLLYE